MSGPVTVHGMSSGMIEGPYLDLAHRLIRRAGYEPNDATDVKVIGGMYHKEFEAILIALAYIGARKTDDYGDFRLQDIRSWDRETWGAYWDIQRKFGRLEQQMALAPENVFTNATHDNVAVNRVMSGVHLDAIMETLSDQAVYCVRMIQILRRLEQKGLVPK